MLKKLINQIFECCDLNKFEIKYGIRNIVFYKDEQYFKNTKYEIFITSSYDAGFRYFASEKIEDFINQILKELNINKEDLTIELIEFLLKIL